ncbi:ATP-dependent DNA helicase [Demequina zhanjiangensis]|uniref:DNA 3'-5' helicase n=1 Tax=Demequina zhanjiangensis TaxID=3051659 RepID=A0ABT8FXL4_9MICO|nr:ATP-dependent DNA helicase [Demequina sp. SYSU T00b26]MDN4471646.1 ATP-dependent DNA helicase [Demequina sp. SYSU T00b26]
MTPANRTSPSLVASPSAVEPELDAGQLAAIDEVGGAEGTVVVTGGAGTGRTTLAVALAADAVRNGMPADRLLVLAPTREAAGALRDRVAQAIGGPLGTPVVRTAAAAAFAILKAQAEALELPRPSLISGAEQDVVLRELLEGHAGGRVAPLDWGGTVPQEATLLPGFREELRNLLMRAAERDISPDQLAELGRLCGRPEWSAAAALYAEYEDVMVLRATPMDQGDRYDPATVVSRATGVLAQWSDVVGPSPAAPRWDLVIVDDAHDATAATFGFLRQVARDGARLVLLGNADESVQGYRGAVPDMLAEMAREPGAARLELIHDHRQEAALAAVSARVAERIGMKGSASAREATRAAGMHAGSGAPVTILTAPHRYAQSRAIAAELRRSRHGLEGSAVPWGRMVVIARSGAHLRALRSDLLAADIPCEPLGDGTALHHEPAIAPLLTLLRVGLGQEWDEESVLSVLGSRLIGLDPVAVRRLRRALVREERAGGGARSSAELLIEAMQDPARLGSLEVPEARRAAKAAAAAAAARDRASQPAAAPGAVIWAAWSSLDVAEDWRQAALAGSARDDADLDAVIALLRAAQTFTERLPQAPLDSFLSYLEGQDFAADSLGARGRTADSVAFCTPASAAGREWDLVVVAGLEEGVWPNLRLRDSVLGAQTLADVASAGGAGSVEAIALARGPRDLHAARRAVLDDETRALLVAVSRARHRLVLTAVDDGESQPSRFVALIEEAAGVERQDASAGRGVADLRAAVGWLRATGIRAAARLEDDPQDASALRDLEGTAAQLADLAARGIPGADPQQWHGVPGPSTEAPFWEPDVPVKVSPSRLDAIRTCPLKWALETAGGTTESSDAQQVGLLVHAIAEQCPEGDEEQMLAMLDERWGEVGGRDTWMEQVAYDQAQEMVRRLGRYLRGVDVDRVLLEQYFKVELGRAVVSGIADRVEVRGDEARVVDLKTGRPITKAEAPDHGQLMMYQLVAQHGAFEGVERASDAALLFVGKSSARAGTVVEQPPIEESVARQVLDDAVETMTAPRFTARPNPMCDHCPIRRSCPAHAAGAQVSGS